MSGDPNEWDSYWKGRQDFGVNLTEDRRHRFVSEEYDAPLDAFWQQVFADTAEDAKVLDLACGSGAVLKTAQGQGIRNLTGVDRSPEAIELLTQTQGIQGVASPLDAMPFAANQFDLITSQFGFEYAGTLSLAEPIARVLAPGGRFVALVHMKDGELAKSCDQLYQEAKQFDDTQFIPAAKTFFTELSALESGRGDQTRFNSAAQAQTGPQSALVALAQTGHILAQHVLEGASWLFENRSQHPLQYALDWFNVTDEQNRAHMARMAGMVSVSLSEADIAGFYDALRGHGLNPSLAEAFDPFGGRPAAWILNASKPLV